MLTNPTREGAPSIGPVPQGGIELHTERFAQRRGETVGAESLQARVSLLARRRDWNAVFNKGAAP